MNFFTEQYPEFISEDPRSTRPSGNIYTVTAEFQQLRFQSFFNGYDLTGCRVLDLGSGTAALGAWVLAHGAERYQAVEASQPVAERARQLLKQRFDPSRWIVSTEYVEDAVQNKLQHWDIIIASGVLYAYTDPVPVIDAITKITDTVIIESMEPSFGHLPQAVQEMLYRSNFFQTTPFIHLTEQLMTWGVDRENIKYNGSRFSSAWIKEYMSIQGFDTVDINQLLQQQLSEQYNSRLRFAYRFHRNQQDSKSQSLKHGLVNTTKDIEFKKWKTFGNSTTT